MTSEPFSKDRSFITSEKARVTESNTPISHYHVELDEEVWTFAILIGVSEKDSKGDLVHLFEHLVMRHDNGNGELPTKLELKCSSKWWSANTSSNFVSFELASYTRSCFQRCAQLLIDAVFYGEINQSAIDSETDVHGGRLTTELDVTSGGSRSKLWRDSSSLFRDDENSDRDLHSISVKDLEKWRSQNVSPRTAVFYTSGNSEFEFVNRTLIELLNLDKGDDQNSIKLRSRVQPPKSSSSMLRPYDLSSGKSRTTNPVVVWEGPDANRELLDFSLAKFLHFATLRDRRMMESVFDLTGLKVKPSLTTCFPDSIPSIFTLGFTGETSDCEELIDSLNNCRLDELESLVTLAQNSIDDWVRRQFVIQPGRRPYGSKLFARIRESALVSDESVELAMRPDILKREMNEALSNREKVEDLLYIDFSNVRIMSHGI